MPALPSAAQCGVCVITISYALSCCHLSKYLDRPKRSPSLHWLTGWLANGSAMSLSAFVKSSTIYPIRPQEAAQLSLTPPLLAAPNGFHCKRGIKNAQQIEIRSIIIIAGALTHSHTHSQPHTLKVNTQNNCVSMQLLNSQFHKELLNAQCPRLSKEIDGAQIVSGDRRSSHPCGKSKWESESCVS